MVTSQQIGALAMIEKIIRIWVPMGTPRSVISISLDGDWNRRHNAKFLAESPSLNGSYRRRLENDRSSCLRVSVEIGNQTRFSYYERFNWWELCSTEPFPPNIPREPRDHFYGHMGLLRIWDDDELGEFYNPGQWPDPDAPYSSAKRAEFAARWLPFFRRSCWLSGCRIECSREERREWIQGLTPQEIEEWRLKV